MSRTLHTIDQRLIRERDQPHRDVPRATLAALERIATALERRGDH